MRRIIISIVIIFAASLAFAGIRSTAAGWIEGTNLALFNNAPADSTGVGVSNSMTDGQGVIEICKYASSGPSGSGVSGFFSFTVEGLLDPSTGQLRTFVIPVGFCTGPIIVQWAGPASTTTLKITEIGKLGFALESVTVNPPGMLSAPLILGSKANADGSVTANNPGGGVVEVLVNQSLTPANQTLVNFFNGTAPISQGVIEICKYASSGPSGSGVSGFFSFTVEGLLDPSTGQLRTFVIAVGFCTGPIIVQWAGPASTTTLKITEIGKLGFALESVTVNPPGMLSAPLILGSKANADESVTANNPGGGVVEVLVNQSLTPANQTLVNFFNGTAPISQGVVEICKYAASGPSGAGVSGFFSFTVEGLLDPSTGQLRTFVMPVGFCSGPILVQWAGPASTTTLKVTEIGKAGFQLESVAVIPSGMQSGPLILGSKANANGSVTANNPGGGVVEVLVNHSLTPANQTVVAFFNGRAPVTTVAGANVTVTFVDPIPGMEHLNVTFETVSVPGVTTLTTSATGPAIPSNFSLGVPPVFYDIETTAVFSGSVAVCFDLGASGFPPGADLRLLHFENGAWEDVTTSVAANTICGSVTSLSPFAIVRDSTPPSLNVSLTPNVIWPPNNKMVNIAASISAGDNFDPSPQIRLISITANEPLKTGDIQGASFGTDDRAFQLKATRAGNGVGRIYTITYRATDRSGNVKVTTATVTVPHDQGR